VLGYLIPPPNLEVAHGANTIGAAISDGEEASDIDFDAPAPVTKKTNREKKRASYVEEEPGELEPEDIPAAEEENGGDEEEGDEDDEEEEDVYVFPRRPRHGLC
jgi:hypothetical protein